MGPDALAVVRPNAVYLLDFFCSGIQFYLLLSPYLCFISFLYLDLYVQGDNVLLYPPANFVCRGYTVFTLSVRPCIRPSVTFCFLNNSKSHCWIFIKPCKHVHICKTNTLDKKVRARGQFYLSYFHL